MAVQKRHSAQRESQTWIVLLCVGVGVLLVYLAVNHLVTGEKKAQEEEERRAAYGALEAARMQAAKLAESQDFEAAGRVVGQVAATYPAFSGEEDFKRRLGEAIEELEAMRAETYQQDVARLQRALKSQSFDACRQIADRIRRYASPRRIEQLDQAMLQIATKEKAVLAETALREARAEADRLAKERAFREAREVLRRVAAKHIEALSSDAVKRAYNDGLRAIEKQREGVFTQDWERLLAAERSHDLALAGEIQAGVRDYGTAEHVKKVREKVEAIRIREAEQALAGGGEPERYRSPVKRSVARPKPKAIEPSRDVKGTDDRGYDGPGLTRQEVSDYLNRLRRQWRQELTSPAGAEVSGEVTVILDALAYNLAVEALEKLEEGKTTKEVMQSLAAYVRSYRTRYDGKPIVQVSIDCASSYGLFFPKGDIRSFFVVKYNDDKVAKQILEQNQTPRYEPWTVYTRDRNRMPRKTISFWLFQGNYTVMMAVGSTWNEQRLSVELAGVWGQKKFRRGDTDWPGWNPERRIIQYYLRSPIDFRTNATTFYAAERASKRIPMPPALQWLVEKD